MTLPELLTKFPDARKTGTGWSARCPAHEDRNASLSLSTGSDGRVLVNCHAGCPTEQVCNAIGIKLADLFQKAPATNRNRNRRIVATYDYHDAAGKLLFQVCRYDPKDFTQRRPDPAARGGYAWDLKGITRVLFHLPQLLTAVRNDRTVFVCEGEKDVLEMEQAGFAATTNAGGANAWKAEYEYSKAFEGADVVIVADKDTAGRKHAQVVAADLHLVTKSLKVIELPDVNGHSVKDAADYFAAGGDPAELDAIAQDAPAWTPHANTEPGNSEYLPVENEATTPAVPVPGVAIEAKLLADLVRHGDHDPDELLRHRYLCRGGILLLAGPSGIGKSSFAMQAMLSWAIGQECFGVEPTAGLKSLLVQAENDPGDLAEMRDGGIAGLELDSDSAAIACERITVVQEDRRTGAEFCNSVLRPLLSMHRPDLLWIDPALAFLGGDTSSQEVVGGFLRNHLIPLLREFHCGCVIIHHTNKPPSGREKPDWQAGDFAYLGSGSAEWANVPRAVLALRSIGSHHVYELRAGKRGGRLRWSTEEGEPSFVRYIAHAKEPGRIYWCIANPEELPTTGRPKTADPNELFELLPPEGLTSTQWRDEAASECGIKERSFYTLIKTLEKDGRVLKSKTDKKWKPLKK